ncbi:monodehydroascorbate reductase [Tanacetum coccineum]
MKKACRQKDGCSEEGQLLPSNLIYLYVCPTVGFTYAYAMADMNIPANDVPAEEAPAIAPPTRMGDQILPIRRWVPIGKSNYVLDVLKSQRNPIFKMVVAILKNTNFFKAFTCQVDEQWFNLHKDILKDALQITPINDDNLFVAPPLSDAVIEYVNTLGYPCTLRNVSTISVNDLYQPWRAILSMINMCLKLKTVGHDRPRHPVLQILWGIIHRSNIDYAKGIWEEFVQSIQTFFTDKKRLTMTLRGKKKSAPLLIPSIRFTKLMIHHLNTKHNIHSRTGSPLHYSHDDNILGNLRFVGKDGREAFGMPIPDALLTDAIKRSPYYGGYLAHVAEYQQHLDGEHGMAEEGAVPESLAPKATKVIKPAGDKTPKPTSSQPPKPTPAPTKPSKAVLEKKRKLVKETPDEPSPAKRSKVGLVGKRRKPKSPLKLVDEFTDKGVPMSEPRIVNEEADYQRAMELSLKDLEAKTQGLARTVVIQEPDFGRFERLPEVQGKGKEKVFKEQAARDLLTLQTLKKQSLADQFIFQRRTPTTTKPSGNAKSPSLDAELAIADNEGQAGSDPGKQDEGHARSNPSNTVVFQPQPSHVVHAGPNLEPIDLAENLKLPTEDQVILEEPASSTRTLSTLQHLEKELNFTGQFFVEKPQEEELEKTNAESEVQLSNCSCSLPTSTTTTITITTTTTLPPPPLQPQHSTIDPILIRRISELEQHMANLIQDNSALEERLNKQGSRLYNLENLNIPQKVSKAVDEIVTDAVEWALQAPLRAPFRDLPDAKMKEILLQRM